MLSDITNVVGKRVVRRSYKDTQPWSLQKRPRLTPRHGTTRMSNKSQDAKQQIQVPLLEALRKVPDKTQNKVFKIINKYDRCAVPQKTVTSAYNKLGAKDLAKKLLHLRCYCLEKEENNGEFKCGMPQPPGHVGDCSCGASCGSWAGKRWAAGDVDHLASFGTQLVEKAEHSDMLQEVVDHDAANRDIHHDPKDRNFRVNTLEGGLIPRQDCHNKPGDFTLDYKVTDGELCYYNEQQTPKQPEDLELVYCIKADASRPGMSSIRRQNGAFAMVPATCLEKKGGRFHVNYVVMKDGKDVLSLTRGYNNVNAIAALTNTASMRNSCFLLGVQSGGRKKKNQRAHCVILEQQRRQMEKEGAEMQFRGQVKSGGRLHVFHHARIHANYFFDLPDQIQFEFDAHMKAQRSIKALSPLMDCTARSLSHRSLWLHSDNRRAKMRSENASRAIFAAAEEARGTDRWDAVSRASGAKGLTIAEAGDPRFGLDPDPSMSVWSRMAHETYHEKGIICNSFRDAFISLAPPKLREQLSQRPSVTIQPVGTKPMPRYVHFSKTWKSHFAGEKLMNKDHWRRHRMILDLIPLCDGDADMTSFVETWHLFVMIDSNPRGLSMNMMEGWLVVTKSLMIQFEHLAVTRDAKLLKKCSIT